MSDDLRRLFEHAEREMRPEFQARLVKLLDDEDRMVDDATWTEHAAFAADVELERHRSPQRRTWHPGAWLGVAAGLALFVVLVVATRSSDGPAAPVLASPVTTVPLLTTVPPVAQCGLVAETLGVVATETGDIRVGIMPDGSSFCLVDDATGVAILGSEHISNASSELASASEPTIVGHGVADTTAYYFVVEIPDGLPVASIRAPGDQVWSFPTRVGRQMLVIDTDFDLRAGPNHVTHDLHLYSSTGVILATLVADIDALNDVTGSEGS